jgi:hypothetical protein
MYNILNIIYGCPINENISKYFDENELEFEDFGFETFYHGSSYYKSGYIGIKLKSINLIGTILDLKNFQMNEIEENLKNEVFIKINSLPDDIKKLLDAINFYCVVSTS